MSHRQNSITVGKAVKCRLIKNIIQALQIQNFRTWPTERLGKSQISQ